MAEFLHEPADFWWNVGYFYTYARPRYTHPLPPWPASFQWPVLFTVGLQWTEDGPHQVAMDSSCVPHDRVLPSLLAFQSSTNICQIGINIVQGTSGIVIVTCLPHYSLSLHQSSSMIKWPEFLHEPADSTKQYLWHAIARWLTNKEYSLFDINISHAPSLTVFCVICMNWKYLL